MLFRFPHWKNMFIHCIRCDTFFFSKWRIRPRSDTFGCPHTDTLEFHGISLFLTFSHIFMLFLVVYCSMESVIARWKIDGKCHSDISRTDFIFAHTSKKRLIFAHKKEMIQIAKKESDTGRTKNTPEKKWHRPRKMLMSLLHRLLLLRPIFALFVWNQCHLNAQKIIRLHAMCASVKYIWSVQTSKIATSLAYIAILNIRKKKNFSIFLLFLVHFRLIFGKIRLIFIV